jgi:hypothetical protein
MVGRPLGVIERQKEKKQIWKGEEQKVYVGTIPAFWLGMKTKMIISDFFEIVFEFFPIFMPKRKW